MDWPDWQATCVNPDYPLINPMICSSHLRRKSSFAGWRWSGAGASGPLIHICSQNQMAVMGVRLFRRKGQSVEKVERARQICTEWLQPQAAPLELLMLKNSACRMERYDPLLCAILECAGEYLFGAEPKSEPTKAQIYLCRYLSHFPKKIKTMYFHPKFRFNANFPAGPTRSANLLNAINQLPLRPSGAFGISTVC